MKRPPRTEHTMTINTITTATISALLAESASVGDTRAVGLCRGALAGSRRSLCAVVGMIRRSS